MIRKRFIGFVLFFIGLKYIEQFFFSFYYSYIIMLLKINSGPLIWDKANSFLFDYKLFVNNYVKNELVL